MSVAFADAHHASVGRDPDDRSFVAIPSRLVRGADDERLDIEDSHPRLPLCRSASVRAGQASVRLRGGA
jgi:hypothetical protein